MIRFEIKNQTLFVTDMVSGKRRLTKPKRVCFYRAERLINNAEIQIYDEDQENHINSNLVTVKLSEAEDETGTAFVTVANFEAWAEQLGFSTAPGGSGAVNSVNSGLQIEVDNSDPANPVINYDGPVDFFSVKAGLTRVGQTTVALANVQSLVFEDYLTLQFTPTQSGKFTVGGWFIWSANATFQNVIFQLSIIQQGGGLNVVLVEEIGAVYTDGTGEVVNVVQNGLIVGNLNTGTDQRTLENFIYEFDLIEGETYTMKLSWTAPPGHRPTIYNGYLFAEQKTKV